jgi:hypothetical protein
VQHGAAGNGAGEAFGIVVASSLRDELLSRLRLDRRGQRVPLIRNYSLQYALTGTLFLLTGLVTLVLGNVVGLGLIVFGLIGFAFSWAYYRFS